MSNETISNNAFVYNHDSIKNTINKLAEAISTLHVCQQINLEGCTQALTEFVQVLSEYQEIRTHEISNSLDSFVRTLSEFSDLTIECPEDTAKYEDSLNTLIEAAPLEETQKTELKCDVEEKLKSGDNWDRKQYNLAVIALIISTILGILQIATAGGDSVTTFNINSPTIVIDDAEAVEEYIAQISELLDEFREE